MFVNFFYQLRESGIPVTPTSFLRLQRAFQMGLINNLDDFYTSARSILVKSERFFDIYDQNFAYYFEGVELPELEGFNIDDISKALLDEWLKNPEDLADALGMDSEKLKKMTPEELIEYFMDRLKEQTEAHHGGNKWIGTGGTSPVGHSGIHPDGMRVGGVSRNKSAVKVALDRRYRDYSIEGPLTQLQIGEALKRLRNMLPSGPKDLLNIDETIKETVKNAGEIEIIFERSFKDKLKIILMIDNGGWSMDPFVDLVQTLFNYSRNQFKDIKSYFFHNTIYSSIWEDTSRVIKPVRINDFSSQDPETRLIIIGDASMAPYELMSTNGSIYVEERSGNASIRSLRFLADTFRHSVWLNPVPCMEWGNTRTIGIIASIFPMFELSLDGLEKGVAHMMKKN